MTKPSTAPNSTEPFFPIAFLMQLMFLITGGSIVGFILWCVLDYYLVVYAPSEIHNFNWVGFVYLFVLVAVIKRLLRIRGFEKTIVLGFFVSVMVTALTSALIYAFGIGFHFSIGGTL